MTENKYEFYFSEEQKQLEQDLGSLPAFIYINKQWKRYTEMVKANDKSEGWIPHEERFDDSEFLGTLPESRVYIEYCFK